MSGLRISWQAALAIVLCIAAAAGLPLLKPEAAPDSACRRPS